MTETIAGSLLFLRLESTAGRKRRGPAKPAPQSIPSPLVRHLVAWVAPSAVLRASAEIVGRRASLTRQLTPKRGQKRRGRKDREVAALDAHGHGDTAFRRWGHAQRPASAGGGRRGHFRDAAGPLLKRRGYAVVAGPARERQADGLTLRLARRLHRISRRTAPDAPPAELREPAWRAAAGRCPPP